jgi:hypothetical protein
MMCPGLVACNILQADAGVPMCGERLRSWGDYVPEVAIMHPINSDANPAHEAPAFAPPPFLGAYEGNPYCGLCAELVNLAKSKGVEAGDEMCDYQPMSMRATCQTFWPKLKRNEDFLKAVEEGCTDVTGKEKAEECPGLVACNTIRASSGVPMCGQAICQWGLPAGEGEGEEGAEEGDG